MTVSYRFARLRDRTLRVRVSLDGPDCLTFSTAVMGWDCTWAHGLPLNRTFTGPEIDTLISRLIATGQEAPSQLARELHDKQAALFARPTPAAPPAGVVDDRALRALVRARPAGDSWLIEELGLAGVNVRVDIAALTDLTWHGTELKGHTDTLTRLPRQIEGYSAVFDSCELVTVPRHIDHALGAVPEWWRVTVAAEDALETVQEGAGNPGVNPQALARMLWRPEALEALRRFELARGMSAARRFDLCDQLCEHLPVTELRQLVTATMRARPHWVNEAGNRHPIPRPGN